MSNWHASTHCVGGGGVDGGMRSGINGGGGDGFGRDGWGDGGGGDGDGGEGGDIGDGGAGTETHSIPSKLMKSGGHSMSSNMRSVESVTPSSSVTVRERIDTPIGAELLTISAASGLAAVDSLAKITIPLSCCRSQWLVASVPPS